MSTMAEKPWWDLRHRRKSQALLAPPGGRLAAFRRLQLLRHLAALRPQALDLRSGEFTWEMGETHENTRKMWEQPRETGKKWEKTRKTWKQLGHGTSIEIQPKLFNVHQTRSKIRWSNHVETLTTQISEKKNVDHEIIQQCLITKIHQDLVLS